VAPTRGVDYPGTWSEFVAWIADEAAGAAYLERLGWPEAGVVDQERSPALGLQKLLGLGSYETACAWLHKLRRAMVIPGRDLLHGEVEVDETYVGGEETRLRRAGEGKESAGSDRRRVPWRQPLAAILDTRRGDDSGRFYQRRR